MDKKSKILTTLFLLLLIVIVGFTIYKYGVKKDYLIYGSSPCDSQVESCFYYLCEEGDDTCNPNEIEYYKKVEKKASNIELCDTANEACNPLNCEQGEKDCIEIFCSDDLLDEGEACSI
jgi:hypothetical protein